MAAPDAGHGGGTPSSRLGSMPLRGWRLAVVAFIGLVFSAGPLLVSSYWVGLLTQMVILAILAMSLDILLGYTGLPSFGHAAFFGVAAYGVAVLATASSWSKTARTKSPTSVPLRR